MAISVMSKPHLDRLGLFAGKSGREEDEEEDEEEAQKTLDLLLLLGLEKIPFLPYAYILDKWRFDVFSGKIKPENYNSAWWEMRYVSSWSPRCFLPGGK